MALSISDELLGAFVPIVVYWVYSAIYMAFGSLDKFRLHSRKEKNLVSKPNVIKNVLFQPTLQATLAIFLYKVIGNECLYWIHGNILCTDTSTITSSYTDTSILITIDLSFPTLLEQSTTTQWRLSLDDHCGVWLPGNLFHTFFNNNSAYHDVHHHLCGGKYNFSQPFFVMWDRIMGTYMPYSLENRPEGGYEARPIKSNKNHDPYLLAK
ncbi:hypothetical protein V6N11_067895 [Hibiscus sabdariffa]|uniref:Fatty acid hydroxylase domain-containing protein n=1 Tax=Hibiscus sabdariffa TaxID=183260 RepID=A0ABR2SS51_9ROSI